MSEAIQKTVLELMDCWRAHDLDGALSRMAEDAVFTSSPKAAALRGREAIRELWARYMQVMPSYALEVINIMSSDRVVFLERVERFRLPDDKPMVLNILPLVGVYEFNPAGKIAA